MHSKNIFAAKASILQKSEDGQVSRKRDYQLRQAIDVNASLNVDGIHLYHISVMGGASYWPYSGII